MKKTDQKKHNLTTDEALTLFFDKSDDDNVGSRMDSNFSGDEHLFFQEIDLVEDTDRWLFS